MNTLNPYISIGVFIDGGYLAKINEALENHFSLNIDITSFFLYLQRKIADIYSLDPASTQITESHYFRGRYRVRDAYDKNLLFSERRFEDSLIENDVVFHYKHLREIGRGEHLNVIEKGVDVWFALEAYELALFREFDFIVLMTGDADHEMLARKLKSLKVRVVLVTWDVTDKSATSRLLKDEAALHLEISKEVLADPELLKQVTMECKK